VNQEETDEYVEMNVPQAPSAAVVAELFLNHDHPTWALQVAVT